MKKCLLAVLFLFLVVALVGCVAPRQYYMPPANGSQSAYQPDAGYVPVVIVNPSPGLTRHIFLFQGYERVELIPDARTGGWMFSRWAIAEFKIAPASGSNWHEEAWIRLPRNSAFTIFDQAERFWGSPVGQPNIYGFTTGSSPIATSYWRPTPTGGQATAGAVVQLPYVDPSGPSQLRLHYDWNPGAAIKEFLFRGLGR